MLGSNGLNLSLFFTIVFYFVLVVDVSIPIAWFENKIIFSMFYHEEAKNEFLDDLFSYL